MKRLSRRAIVALLLLAALTAVLWERASWRPRLVAPPPAKYYSYFIDWAHNDLLYCAVTSHDVEVFQIPKRGSIPRAPVQTIPFPGSLAAGDIVVSRDGTRVVVVNSVDAGVIWLWDTTRRKEQMWHLTQGAPTRAVMLDDNRTIAATWWAPEDGDTLILELHDALTGASKKWRGFRYSPALSWDGKSLAVQKGKDVVLFDLPSRRQRWVLRSVAEHYQVAPSLSPNGRYLAVIDTSGLLTVCDAPSGQLLWKKTVRSGKGSMFCYIEWAPDASLLATTSDEHGTDRALRIWDASTGNLRHELLPSTNPHAVQDMAFSPDGARLATSREDVGVEIWRVK